MRECQKLINKMLETDRKNVTDTNTESTVKTISCNPKTAIQYYANNTMKKKKYSVQICYEKVCLNIKQSQVQHNC